VTTWAYVEASEVPRHLHQVQLWWGVGWMAVVLGLATAKAKHIKHITLHKFGAL
jgi:hypothetical protein